MHCRTVQNKTQIHCHSGDEYCNTSTTQHTIGDRAAAAYTSHAIHVERTLPKSPSVQNMPAGPRNTNGAGGP